MSKEISSIYRTSKEVAKLKAAAKQAKDMNTKARELMNKSYKASEENISAIIAFNEEFAATYFDLPEKGELYSVSRIGFPSKTIYYIDSVEITGQLDTSLSIHVCASKVDDSGVPDEDAGWVQLSMFDYTFDPVE